MPFPTFLANSIYECENTTQLIEFYHATLSYPAVSTWCKAITAGYFQGWPGLTAKRVRRFIKVSDETEMRHMDQQRQGIRSTKRTETEPDSMATVPQIPNSDRCHHVYMTIADVDGKLYSDQTGSFGGNYVKLSPIKSGHRSELLKAYNEVYSFLCVRGYRPQLHKWTTKHLL